jgi:hypothetical protein
MLEDVSRGGRCYSSLACSSAVSFLYSVCCMYVCKIWQRRDTTLLKIDELEKLDSSKLIQNVIYPRNIRWYPRKTC